MGEQMIYNELYGKIDSNPDPLYQKYRRKWNENWQSNKVENFPLFLDIEATSACNLRCPDCVQTINKQKAGYMDFDLFKKIINEASEQGCYGCKFHTIGRGEPLLHKDIAKMVAYAKKKGLIDVYLNTNAVLLTLKISEQLIDAGVDRISISMDHYYKEAYEGIRVGASFDKVKYNIEKFKFVRDYKRSKCKIRIQAVENQELNLQRYREFWMRYADEIGIIDYKDMIKREDMVSNWRCSQLWQRASILYDGAILPCNHDDRKFAVLGNANTDSIGKIWRSNAMNYMRQIHNNGNSHLLAACNGCFLRTTMIKKEKEL